MATPKFEIWDKVKFRYGSWSRTEWGWEVEGVVVGIDPNAAFWMLPEHVMTGYMLKVNPGDLDKVDREALEGPERNWYGHLKESSLTLVSRA